MQAPFFCRPKITTTSSSTQLQVCCSVCTLGWRFSSCPHTRAHTHRHTGERRGSFLRRASLQMDTPKGYGAGHCREKLDTLICLLCNAETQPTSSSLSGTHNHMLSLMRLRFHNGGTRGAFWIFLKMQLREGKRGVLAEPRLTDPDALLTITSQAQVRPGSNGSCYK